MEKGFYKYDSSSELLHAPNFVYCHGVELKVELKDNYTYPVMGWVYFDTLKEAYDNFGLDYAQYLIDNAVE
jgi:hypothetical protein